MADSIKEYPYEGRLNILRPSLEIIDERGFSDACEDKWFNQTLRKVNEPVARMGGRAMSAREGEWIIRSVNLVIASAFALSVALTAIAQAGKQHPPFEMLTHRMDVDVDGAPNAYGPPNKETLDFLQNAHYLNRENQEIVGYLTDEHGRPILQGPNDPFPGYYISQTAFTDIANQNERDPRRYVDARNINYVVRGNVARRRGVKVGDFVSVYSRRTHKGVFAIVGDTGNPTGDEGSLHLLQELGYPFHDGKNDSVEKPEIVIRFYPNSNPQHQFFFAQADLDKAATQLGLSREFVAAAGTNR